MTPEIVDRGCSGAVPGALGVMKTKIKAAHAAIEDVCCAIDQADEALVDAICSDEVAAPIRRASRALAKAHTALESLIRRVDRLAGRDATADRTSTGRGSRSRRGQGRT
jgi:hypothetical protein